VLYYSGHGMQVRGENYLIPVGETIESEDDVELYGVELKELMTRLRAAGHAPHQRAGNGQLQPLGARSTTGSYILIPDN